MTRPGPAVVVPIHLGCCPPGSRCGVCGAPPEPPTTELVEALIGAYRRDRGEPLRVGFFGGEPPSDALLDAIGGLPFTVRVRPDQLDRAQAKRLAARGCVGVELDAWTLNEDALKATRRPYGRRFVLQQLEGLPAFGLTAGIVLAPGLPGTRHADVLADAHTVAPLVSFARIHPVLVVAGSALHDHYRSGAYVPMSLGEALTTCHEVADVFEAHGVDVVRIGQQPRHDGLARVIAGPTHPAFRQLVDARRSLRDLSAKLSGTPRGSRVLVRCHPADETPTRGPLNRHVRTLRAMYGLAAFTVRPDPDVPRGHLQLHVSPPARGPAR